MIIKNANGSNLLTIDINEGAVLHQELMKEHYITLPFTLASPIFFKIGSYVDTDFGRFILKDTYKPTRNNTNAGYDYQLRLDAWYYLFANKVVKFMPENDASETTFELTANISTHVQTVMKTVSYLGTLSSLYKYNGTTAISTSIDLDISSEAKYIKYDSVNVIDAFTQIAEAFDCEWWFVDNVLFFGKCERGTAVTFTHLSNVIMTSSGNKQPFANRIIAFGSERNLPHNYRGSESIVNGIVQKRLMLPVSTCPNGYIQTDDVSSESEVVELVRIYDYVYPKVDCEVSQVTTYTSTVENEDGTTTTVTFYMVKDGSGFNFSTDLILEGETLHIIFQSGLLNGMDFECHYNDDEEYYEVIVNENYGIQLPNATLHPSVGDTFILTGWDATQMASTGIVEQAEEKLLEEASKDLAKFRIDPNNYNCEYLADENHTVFPLGQKVELVNPAYFTTTRLSRIIGYEIKLDIPYDHPMYIVGESVAYNRLGTLERMIQQLGVNGALLNEYNTRNWQSIVNYTNLIVGGRLNTIQEQLDHVQVTYFGDYVPTLNNEPASTWASSEYSEHDGDMFYNRTTGKGYEFTYQNGAWGWVEIQDEDIRQALEDASNAQDTADGKRRVFVTPDGTLPTPPYDENDLWVNATYPSNSTSTDESQHKYYNDILKCITPKAEGGTASINDWSLGSKYTDDSSLNAFLNGYTGTLTGIRTDITNASTAASNAQTSANNASSAAATAQAAADALDYLKQAYLADNTLIDHGLILSTIVALRDSNNNVWSGISGAYDSTKLGNGIAAWYGGGMIDKEVSAVANAAKSLFRFDGSGYVANGNLKWDANGNVTIQGYSINATTLQVGGSNVATQAMLDNFVSKAFFNRLFTAYDANGNAIVPNNTTTAINNLKIMVGTWTEQYLSALGLNSQGGGGGTGDVSHIKIGTNPDVFLDPDEDGIIDMSSYAANWNDAYQKRHTHSNKSVLDGITSTKVSHWDAVYGVVPQAAYESGNSLADKNFVNSSISTATATFRGTVTASNDTDAAAATALATITTKDLNDYAFVKVENAPQIGVDKYKRYKYDGSSWVYEYTLNNSSFTSDQWNAINSGITTSLVTKLNGIASGAQVNVIESVKVNGNALSISSKAVDITAVPLSIITGADDLKAIEGLSGTGFLKRTGNNTWALDTTVVLSTRKVSTGNGLQGGGDLSADRTISILLPTNSGLSVASTGLKLNIVNNLTTASDYRAISATQAKKIWDLLNQMFTLEGAGTTASPYVIKANYGLYTEQFLSALGQNSEGGSGGDFSEEQMWAALQANTGTYENAKINWNHIPLATTSTAGAIKVGSTLAISNGILNQATIPNLTADVYTKVTVDTYGRVTQGGDLIEGDIPTLSMSKISGLSTALGNVYTKTESDGKYVTALGTSGNYLTYTKNGNSNSITVPYATTATALAFERVNDMHATTGWRAFTPTNSTPSNAPTSSGWATGMTFLPNNDTGGYRHIITFWGSNSNNSLWIQNQWNGTWGNWRKVLDSANSYVSSGKGYINGTEITTVTTASKLGSTTVGGANTPIYLNNGTPTQVTSINGAIVGGYIGYSEYGYLVTHPEATKGLIIPYIYNDLAFLISQGGSCTIYSTTETDLTKNILTVKTDWSSTSTVGNLFDGSPSYWGGGNNNATAMNADGLIIDITLPNLKTYANKFYIDFGNSNWGFDNIDILLKNSANETNYVSKVSGGVVNDKAQYYINISHSSTPQGGGSSVRGFDRMRIHLYGRSSTGGVRIAQIGLIQYNSLGQRYTSMSRGYDDYVYRSITPNTTSTYSLGTSARRWNNIYSTYGNFSADVAIGNHLWLENNRQILFKDSSGVSKQALILDNGNLLNIGYGTSSSGYNTQINGNIIYLNYGTSHKPGLAINSNGNVTIAENLFLFNDKGIYIKDASSNDCRVLFINPSNNLHIGSNAPGNTYLDGNTVYLRYGSTHTIGLTLDSSGNTNLAGSLYFDNNKFIYFKDNPSSGTAINRNVFRLSSGNSLFIGEGSSQAGYNTYINGSNVYLRYGTSNTIGLTLSSTGQVIIPSTGSLKIGDATLSWDSTNQMLKVDKGFYSEGAVSALGSNDEGGGSSTFDEDMMWQALQSTTGTYATTKIATSHIPDTSSLYGYLKSSSLSGYVNAVSTSGSGNAVTSVTKSGNTITFTKGSTFLTSHQTINALTLKADGTTVTTYTPNSATASLDFVAGSNISLTRGTNQITIANTYSYTLPLAASGTRGGVQIGYSETNSGTSTTRNYAVKLSSEKMYVNVPWTDTTYKLTLNGTTNGASGGTSLGSFYAPTASGTANQVLISGGSNTAPSWTAQSNLSVGTAAKLGTGTTTYTAWGQTYWSSGVPQSISGNMTSVGSITPSANGNALGTTSARFNIYGTSGNFSGNVSIGGTLGVTGATTLSSTLSVASGITLTTTKKIYFGDTSHYLELNSTGFHFSHGVYSDSFVSALGANSSGGGGGGIDIEAMWAELQGNTGTYANAKINVNHIPDISSTYGYAKTSQLGSYLPLSGGTITVASNDGLVLKKSTNTTSMIRYEGSSGLLGYLGFYVNSPACNINNEYKLLLHEGNYSSYALPLTGGTISTNSAYPLIIADSRSSSTLFVATGYQKGSTTLGYLGFSSQDIPVYVSSNAGNSYPLLHSDNYSSYALPLTGGTVTLSSIDGLTINKSNNAAGMIRFTNGSTLLGYLGYYGIENPACNVGGTYYSLVHEGNYDSIIGNSYIRRKTYGLDGGKAVRITFNSVNGGIINVRSTLANASLILVGNGYGEGGTTRNNWVQLSSTTSYFSWCIPTASGIEKSVEIYNNTSNSASVVVASFDTGVTFTELSALSTTASTVKVAYASDYLPLTGGTMTGSIKMDATAKGYYLVDSAGVSYPALWDNGGYLCIGANAVSGTHHTGNTYISAGSGEVYISRLVNNSRASYKNLDAGNTYVSRGIGYLNGNEITTISGNAATATKATQDGSGNTITSTYLTSVGISGDSLVQTKGGTTSSVANIFYRDCTVQYTLSTTGWYRIAAFSTNLAHGGTCFLLIRRTFNSASPESYIFAITIRYGSGISISQLSGTAGVHLIDKIRVEYANNTSFAPQIDIHVSTTTNGNSYRITTIGSASVFSTATLNPTVANSTYEYATRSGMSCSGDFYAGGEVTAASDERKKNIISNTKFNVKDIASARSILYEWNDGRDSGQIHGGSIAQDWLGKADSFLSQDNDGFYSINYGALALCSAITIAREVLKHGSEIDRLKQENERLKARVSELERRVA